MNQTEQSQNTIFDQKESIPMNDLQQITNIAHYIPDQFYDNNSDATHVMLNMLPNGLDPHFSDEANSLQQKFISAADMISKKLSISLESKYMDVIKAMNLIYNLNDQLNLSTQNISILRQILQNADSEICQNPENFFHQIQKQRNLNTVLNLLSFVKQIKESSEKLNQALEDNDFVSAIELCFKPVELSTQVQSLRGVEHFISSLGNTYSRIINKMDTVLVYQTEVFDPNIYGNLISAYDHLNKLDHVPQKLQESFVNRLNTKFNSIVDTNNFKSISKFRDMINSIFKFCKSLLSTYQQITSFHRSTIKYNSIQSSIDKMIDIIWSRIENNLSLILSKIPIQKMNFDSFNNLITIINDFIQYGATIVDSTGSLLNQTIIDIGSNYFSNFHKNTLESILENIELDTWTTIPTDTEFEHQILTFKIISHFSHNISTTQIQSSSSINLSLITNSCITVIKSIHQYITILNSVPSLSVEIIQSIRELVEYYSFSILNVLLKYSSIKPFEFDETKQNMSIFEYSTLLPNNGLQLIIRMVHHLTNKSKSFTFPTKFNIENNDKINFEQIAITAKNNMNSISWYLKSVKTILEDSLPSNSLGSFRRFYSDFVTNFLDNFAHFSFQYIIPKIIDLTPFTQQIKEIKFDKNYKRDEQHQFSKTWMLILDIFIQKLEKDAFNENDIELLLHAFWDCSSFFAINELSLLVSASPDDISSLILDFSLMTQYLNKILRNNAHIDCNWIVEYINASFLKKDEFISWAEINYNKYTLNHLIAIIDTGLADKINKKEKMQTQERIKKFFKI